MKISLAVPIPIFKPLSWPKLAVLKSFKKVLELPSILFDSLPVTFTQPRLNTRFPSFSLTQFKRNHHRLYRIFVFLLATILVIGIIFFLIQLGRTSQTLSVAKTTIGQTYQVIARDQNGNPTGNSVNLVITDAEKTKSVLIQGKRANVRNGKLFLLLNFEMDNPSNTVYYINPTDLVRYLRSDGKKFAPTVYQGILQIRPNSTKKSNIGFVVDEGEYNFKLEVGELESTKQALEVGF